MNSIRYFSVLLCLSAMVCVFIELLIPPGKVGKMVKLVLGVFILCVMITPFDGKTFRFDFKFKDKIAKQNDTSKFLENINTQIEDNTKNNIKSIILKTLKDINIFPEKIEIFMDTNHPECISIIKCKVYISENINQRGKIKDEIENKLKIETEVIIN